MVNNFELLSTLFDGLIDKDDFYFVEIMQRKKDGINLPSNTHGARIIRSFYFFSKEEFLKRVDYMKQLCEDNHARAYFWVNPRNTTDIACECIKQYAEIIKTGNTRLGMSVFDSATGSSRSNHYEKLWILDVDSKDQEYCQKILDVMNSCRGRDTSGNRLKYTIPTSQGYHFITTAFDRNQFAQELAIRQITPIDIHDNNPTLLYYNNEERIDDRDLIIDECTEHLKVFQSLMFDMTTPICGEEYLVNELEPLIERLNERPRSINS